MLRIKEARESRGWTQAELAETIKTTQQTVQRWEAGQDIKSRQLVAISRALGVTVSYLLGADDGSKDDGLADGERELVALYRGMDNAHKRLLIDTARSFTALKNKH